MKTALNIFFVVVGIVAIVLTISAFETVSEGERALILRFGKSVDVKEPGFYMVNPLTTDVITFDITTNKVEGTASAATKDLQTVTATIAVNYSVDPTSISEIYQQYGKDYEKRVVIPAIQEEVKAATAKYTAEEVVTKREEVRNAILDSIKVRAERSHLVVADVLITDFQFSAQFNSAIEAKVTAEQEALRAKNDLNRIKTEAEQKVAQAKAEAESIRLQSEAANNDKYVKLKQLEVQMEFAKHWDGRLPVNMYGSAPIPFIDIN